MANRFILNETSYHGAGAIKEVVTEVKARGLKKGLVVTDKDLIKFGVATKVTDLLEEAGLPYEIYDEVKANPTVEQVKNGVQAAKNAGADYLIAIGGGSPQDTCKGIGIILLTLNLKMLLAWKVLLQLKTNLSQLSLLRLQQVRLPKLQSTM